jgi:hypothetical protein
MVNWQDCGRKPSWPIRFYPYICLEGVITAPKPESVWPVMELNSEPDNKHQGHEFLFGGVARGRDIWGVTVWRRGEGL